MKWAPIFVLAGVSLAATAWFLTGGGPDSVPAERISVQPRTAREAEKPATVPNGGDVRSLRPTLAGERPSAPVVEPGRSGSTDLPVGGVRPANETTSGGTPLQTEALDAIDAATPSLPATAPSGQVATVAASAPAPDTLPPSLVTAAPAWGSSVSPPLAVPAGARLPALFLDERPLPPAQRRVLDRIANEFIDAVAGDPSGQNRALWESARAAADQQYIKLYGHAAYNALHLRAAKEAVREQRATAAPTPP